MKKVDEINKIVKKAMEKSEEDIQNELKQKITDTAEQNGLTVDPQPTDVPERPPITRS
jgi:hypothetical protein